MGILVVAKRHKTAKWDLSRAPTSTEQGFAAIASGILSVVFCPVFFVTAVEGKEPVATTIVGIIAGLSVFVFLRALFTNGEPLGRRGKIVSAIAVTTVGFGMLICSVVYRHVSNRAMLVSLGLAGIAIGTATARAARRDYKNRNTPNDTEDAANNTDAPPSAQRQRRR